LDKRIRNNTIGAGPSRARHKDVSKKVLLLGPFPSFGKLKGQQLTEKDR